MAKCMEKIIRELNGILTIEEIEHIANQTRKRLFGHEARPGQEPVTDAATIAEYEASITEGVSPKQMEHYQEIAHRLFTEAMDKKKDDLRRAYMQTERNMANENWMMNNASADNGHTGAVVEFLSGDRTGRGEHLTLEARIDGETGLMMSQDMAEAMQPYTTLWGMKMSAESELNFVKELDKPGSTGDKDAARLAKAELARQARTLNEINEQGGNIKQLKDRRLPQSWNADETRVFGLTDAEKRTALLNPFVKSDVKDELRSRARGNFIDAAMQAINRDKYTNRDGSPMGDQDVMTVIGQVFDTIVSGGLSNKPVIGGRSGLAVRLAAHRELHFKSGEAWLEFNRKMGNKDVIGIIMDDMQQQARNIALLKVFGPDPEAGFVRMNAMAKFYDSTYIGDANRIGKNSRIAEHIFYELSGLGTQRGNEIAARWMKGLRQWMVATKLGSVLLSQINDLGVYATIARADGLGMGEALEFAMKNLAPGSAEDKRLASFHGMLWQSIISDAGMRFGEAAKGTSLPAKLANFTIRAGGMKHWQDSMQRGYQMTIGGHMATEAKKGAAFGELDTHFRQMLQRYGIDEPAWNIIRQAEGVNLMGHDVITPVSVKLLGDSPEIREAAIKVAGMMSQESRVAVVEPGAYQRAFMTENVPAGTLVGEFARSAWLFHSFSAAMIQKVFPRIFRGDNEPGFRAGLAAQFALSMMIAGAVSYQLKEVSKGRNPRPVDNVPFWIAAALQSGGAGIFGDFMFGDVNKFGGGLATTMAGPIVGLLDDTRKLTIGNIIQASKGEETHFGAELLQFAKNNAPGINLFYTRAALDHLLFYQVQEAVNPGYLERMEDRLKAEQNQTFWWRPQDRFPDSIPNLSELKGGQ